MGYPPLPDFKRLTEEITFYAQLKHEYGAKGIPAILREVEHHLRTAASHLKRAPIDQDLAAREPNDFLNIRALRPDGPRRIWNSLSDEYTAKLEGAFIGRMAGCTLGAPVEFWPIATMKALAEENGDPFPPTDYWKYVPEPAMLRYGVSPRIAYTHSGMNGVPVDDDLMYTVLGLLVVELHGTDFTTADIARTWLRYLPHACTAEDVALNNLKAGCSPFEAGEKENPYCEWIGADIRADPWGYLAPGWPERAAALAYRDAYLSHRRQGIYGAMFFASAISAAFTVDDPLLALRIGLTEVPEQSALAQAVRWALEVSREIRDHRHAREALEAQFPGMSRVHTINNACLTIWGLTIGRTDFTRVIGETVAMGMDNDCNAATAGSIIGAIVGAKGIDDKWRARFHDTLHSYLTGCEQFSISDLLRRFAHQARNVHGSALTP